MKVKAISCDHVFDVRPGGMELNHLVIEGQDANIKMEKDWKYCPICGREVFIGEKENEYL